MKTNLKIVFALFVFLITIYLLLKLIVQHKSAPVESYTGKYGLIIKFEDKDSARIDIFEFAFAMKNKNKIAYSNVWHVYLDTKTVRYAPFNNYEDLNYFYIQMQTKFPDVKMRLDIK